MKPGNERPAAATGWTLKGADGIPFPVSEEVYANYRHLQRKERYQEEQKRKMGIVSLDALGHGTNYLSSKLGGCGSEIEDGAVRACYMRILYEELDRLSLWDKRMVGLLYYSGLTVKEAAGILRCSRGKIFAHRDKVLKKIRRRFAAEGINESGV